MNNKEMMETDETTRREGEGDDGDADDGCGREVYHGGGGGAAAAAHLVAVDLEAGRRRRRTARTRSRSCSGSGSGKTKDRKNGECLCECALPADADEATTTEMMTATNDGGGGGGECEGEEGEEEEEEDGRMAPGTGMAAATASSPPEDDARDASFSYETRAVFWLKMAMLALMLLSTLGIALGVYSCMSSAEYREFVSVYSDHADHLLQSISNSLFLSLGAVDAFVVDKISRAQEQREQQRQQQSSDAAEIDDDGASASASASASATPSGTWPFVTHPNNAVIAAKVRSLSKAFAIVQYNVVSERQRRQWEEYSVENDGWVKEAMRVQRSDKNYHGLLLDGGGGDGDGEKDDGDDDGHLRAPFIFDNDGYVNSTGPHGYHLPVWQSYPVVPRWAPYNWDAASRSLLSQHLPTVVSRAEVQLAVSNMLDPSDPQAVRDVEVSNAWAADFLSRDGGRRGDDDGVASEPHLQIFYPMALGAADSVSQIPENGGGGGGGEQGNSSDGKNGGSSSGTPEETPKVVAVLSTIMFWRELLVDILPKGPGSVVAVFRLGEFSTFTYLIDGLNATYLGPGDLHDSRYDHLVRSCGIGGLKSLSSTGRDYTGLPLSAGANAHTIHLYPAEKMERHFTSTNAALFTALIILTYVFTAGVFLTYDWCVEQRQRKNTHRAVLSSANIAQLESRVRERTRKLEASNAKLEAANRKIQQAADAQLKHFACMSHEIRTPLNCIIGLSSLLEETELNPMQKDSMGMIVTSGDLLLTIVNDILDYSKLTSGNVDIDIKRSEINRALESVVHSVSMRAQSRDVTLIPAYDPAVPRFVHTDTRRLQQILYNLLGNSVKFSEPGGCVELGVSICAPLPGPDENRYSPTPSAVTREENGAEGATSRRKVIRLEVKDFGKGIHPGDYEKIFKPFLQSDETESIYGGTGLGLAITSTLVHSLGGVIYVESKEGEWCKFTVELPFKEDAAEEGNVPAGLENATVLLVSTQERVREQVARSLHYWRIPFEVLDDLRQLSGFISECHGSVSEARKYVCLVDEDKYDRQTYAEIKSSAAETVLLTFGPGFLVNESRGHYRSVTNILPSVFISTMGEYSKQPKKPRHLDLNEPIISLGSATNGELERNADSYLTMRYLIAEDNIVNQKVLSRILLKLGIKNVEIVDNGKKAVDREASEPFDIIFMDMQMPVMDGKEACHLINERKEEGSHPRAKIIFVTAHVMESFKAECLAAGAVGFLAKPCNVQGVDDCLRGLFSRKAASKGDGWG